MPRSPHNNTTRHRNSLPILAACLLLGSPAAAPTAGADESRKEMESWPNYVDVLAPYIDRAEWIPERYKSDPQLRAELDRFVYYMESMGYFSNFYQRTDYPDFWPIYHQAYPLGFNNPDDMYYGAIVDDTGSYRISGYRHTVRVVDVEVGASEFQAFGTGNWSPTLSHYQIDENTVSLDDDGYFEIILSPARPEGYQGDWWELKKGARLLLVRQMAYDWKNEKDAAMAIERLDVPAMKPRDSAGDIAKYRRNESLWIRNWLRAMVDWLAKLEKQSLVNAIGTMKFGQENATGVTGSLDRQQYMQGIYDISENEALILESEIPDDCRYWMIHVGDQLMGSVDYINRQSSLNGFQARLDEDGKFRAVISIADPGVPNWLDTAGYERGLIMARRLECEGAPMPVLTKVKLDTVREHLPQGTPLVTAEEREQAIRQRREAAQLRRRW
jgi:hypothetical protein